jgi:hypothetical protein
VVGHQAHDLPINANATEIARPIQRVETSLNQIRGVADVVAPSRRYESVRQRQLLSRPPSRAAAF